MLLAGKFRRQTGYRSRTDQTEKRGTVLFYRSRTLRSNGDLYFDATSGSWYVARRRRDVYREQHGLFKVNHDGVNVFMARFSHLTRVYRWPVRSLPPVVFCLFPSFLTFLIKCSFDIGISTVAFYFLRYSFILPY